MKALSSWRIQPQKTVSKVVDGKSDAWNWRNNPTRFQADLNYKYSELPLEGQSARVAWAASYWPYYEDGINHRWLGADVLSPAEKYDKAYNGWTPASGFMDLKPFDTGTCEFDAAYYEGLGPAATWTHRNKGNWKTSNGVDDDKDGIEDADECGWGEEKDRDGIETWWGICHAWAPAAIMEDEPIKAVEHNGVMFEVSDIKALLIQQYDRTDAYMIGGRCEEHEIERDEDTGRVTNDECRDLNAGTFHVITTNFLGVNSRPMVIERTSNYQVWNQPYTGFKITEEREITLAEANELLQITGEPEGNGEFVNEIEMGTADARAILEVANTRSLEELDIDSRLDRRAAQGIVDGRPFATLVELDEVSYVAKSAFSRMLDYAKDQGLWVETLVEYAYNDAAETFVEVRLTTDWVTESSPSVDPKAPEVDRYTNHDYYHYILELDGQGDVIGGEWVGDSRGKHPDFIWLPVRVRSGNPEIDTSEVRALIAKSRAGADSGGSNEVKDYENTSVMDIPDNDPRGIVSVIDVPDAATIKGLTIDLKLTHTYRGDVVVSLRHAGVTMLVFNGPEADDAWGDDIVLTGEELDGFFGASLGGEWELLVVDTMGVDVGALNSWALHAEVE